MFHAHNPATLEQRPEIGALARMLDGLSAAPVIVSMLEEQSRQLASLREEVRRKSTPETDGWLDAKAAAHYLGLSAATFDKYRYLTKVKIKGYRVGGKLLYQRKDLDSFVKLYEINSAM